VKLRLGFFLSLLFALALAARAWALPMPAYRLKLPEKDPLLVKVLDDTDSTQPVSLKEPLLYLGFTVTWRPGSKVADVELGAAKAVLMLGEPWAYLGQLRVGLASAPRWKDGRLILGKEALETILKSLAPAAPAFETATAKELAGLDALPTPEPVLEPHVSIPHATGSAPRPIRGALKCIVIDAGHGGHDPGAHGPDGLQEKSACLDIAMRLTAILRRQWPNVEVIPTRDSDKFVTLRKRTVIANEAKADLFISIHNNASPNSRGRGSQVFFYSSGSSDRAAEDLARRENEDANYMEILMMDLHKKGVEDPSIKLAQCVQNELASDLGITSRKLHYAPFYVLARTTMPAILVEVAFISNPKEEALLGSPAFRQQVAQGIFQGVSQYKVELAKR
jgi:N-acetylmuramoyl-L-alanine amidase